MCWLACIEERFIYRRKEDGKRLLMSDPSLNPKASKGKNCKKDNSDVWDDEDGGGKDGSGSDSEDMVLTEIPLKTSKTACDDNVVETSDDEEEFQGVELTEMEATKDAWACFVSTVSTKSAHQRPMSTFAICQHIREQ